MWLRKLAETCRANAWKCRAVELPAWAGIQITLLAALLLAAPLLADPPKVFSERDWIDSPEAYFLTPAEKALWYRTVLTEKEAKDFIDEYRHKRGDAFKRQVMSRIEFADAHFGIGGLRGSLSARGRVWIILGSPSTERTIRTTVTAAVPGGAQLQNNSIEQRGRVTTEWVYRPERLPKSLQLPSLTVRYITDLSRGFQNIDNLGQVEPYLAKAVELFVADQALPPTGRLPEAVAVPSNVTQAGLPQDPLWKADENLAGAFVTGEPFISPTEQPFYAVSFYVPKNAQAFRDTKSVLFVGLVKTADGKDVTALREQLELQPYGSGGDRYVDRSFALPADNYKATFALFTPEGSTLLAAHHADFVVKPAGATWISSLLLTSKVETLDQQLPLDPFTFVATKYAVKGDRRFGATDRVGFYTVIANPSGEPRPVVSMQLTVTRDGKVLDQTPADRVPLVQTGPHTWLVGSLFEPDTFKPGHYTLEVRLRDLKADTGSNAFMNGYVMKAEFDVAQ
jgi:GWxTD domain-containing protein